MRLQPSQPPHRAWFRISILNAGLGAICLLSPVFGQPESGATILHATGDSKMSPPVSADIVAAVAAATKPGAAGPFQPTWDSVRAQYRMPEWAQDAKFGIFIHWGLFSIPAHHSEWYEKYMYAGGADTLWHAAHFGPLDKFGYKDFIPLFTAVHFDPSAWAALFKASGARYVMVPAEHHDGFSLWDSALNRWNAARVGPKRDLVGELVTALRAQGLRYGVDNHSIEHFTFIDRPPGGIPTDLDDPNYADFYWMNRSPEALQRFLTLWVEKNYELIDKYQPDLLWFDNGINPRVLDPLKLEVAAYYYNRASAWGKPVSIVSKFDAFLAGSIRDHERMGRSPKGIEAPSWEVHDTIGTTWGYTEGMRVSSSAAIVRTLIQAVCRNGCYAVNVSPRGDGSIPEDQQRVLREIGQWLAVNGEAIYGTRPWIRFGEGRLEIPRDQAPEGGDIRFTRNGNTLFAIALAWPGDSLTVKALGTLGDLRDGTIKSVRMLGVDGELKWVQTAQGLVIKTPRTKPSDFPYAFRIFTQ